MPTDQQIGKVREHGAAARGRVLTDEERESARKHAEERDFENSSNSITSSEAVKSNLPKRSFRSTMAWVVASLIFVGIITVIFLFISDAHDRENVRTTAERELKSSAIEINRNLPANNQLNVDSMSVSYVDYKKLVLSFYQGNARCTVPVNPPDKQHYLYWTPKIEPVPVDKLDTTLYKCVTSISPDRLGETTTS